MISLRIRCMSMLFCVYFSICLHIWCLLQIYTKYASCMLWFYVWILYKILNFKIKLTCLKYFLVIKIVFNCIFFFLPNTVFFSSFASSSLDVFCKINFLSWELHFFPIHTSFIPKHYFNVYSSLNLKYFILKCLFNLYLISCPIKYFVVFSNASYKQKFWVL